MEDVRNGVEIYAGSFIDFHKILDTIVEKIEDGEDGYSLEDLYDNPNQLNLELSKA